MYCATTGTFLQRDPLGQPGSPDLLYSDEYVTNQLRNRQTGAEAVPDLINLYAYVSNNPINMTDPSGLIGYGGPPGRQVPRKGPPLVCGFYVWLYTGSGCVTEDVYNAALDAAAGVVNCWFQCEGDVHSTVCGKILTATEVVSGSFSLLAARVPKQWAGMTAEQISASDPYTSLARAIGKRLGGGGIQGASGTRGTLEKAGRWIGRAKNLTTVAKGGLVTLAFVEAGIAWTCSFKCD